MMYPAQSSLEQTRRGFLTSFAGGIGGVALGTLLAGEGRAADDAAASAQPEGRQAAIRPTLPAKAKSCIFIYLVGGPSQLDLYDPKPRVNELHGQPLPGSLTDDVRFAFIEKDSARVMGSPARFRRHGECGMELSQLLPHLSTCADDIALVRSMHTDTFNHHPGELLMNTGSLAFGHPSVGSWLNYGLGSESSDLPGYVVLTCGATSIAGAANWSSGFLPSNFQGVPFRRHGERVLHLENPAGVCADAQEYTRAALAKLNALHFGHVQDPEILARIESYEMAFRLQASIPELTELSDESKRTCDEYGLYRPVPEDLRGFDGGNKYTFDHFSRNCLLARRLVQRGVRFVNLYHASWDHHMMLNKNLARNCQVVDQPIAALLKDLKQRGLLESTLVVCASEFGRTPLGENKIGNTNTTGRDHHPFAFSLWLAGAGVKTEQVIGKTDEFGWDVVEDPIHVQDLHATLLHLFGLDHQTLTYRFRGKDVGLVNHDAKIVDKLLA